ncbi:helicase domain protein [Nitzschia inconspicua]|uniref:Helicase domain protein n=1 Tax=Nitzschia inconspicua TaxID=303405 RepID=A0A9K3K7P6_9STRA|nr:helicase domain protein [Nitzschia inconspicua]
MGRETKVSIQKSEYILFKKKSRKIEFHWFVWTLDAEYRSQVSAEQRRLVHEKAWDRMYERLVKFQKKHGHTMVPNSFDDGEGQPRLGTWVIKQRYRRRRNDPPYSSKRAEKLDSIGFVWTLDAEDLFHQTRDDETGIKQYTDSKNTSNNMVMSMCHTNTMMDKDHILGRGCPIKERITESTKTQIIAWV